MTGELNGQRPVTLVSGFADPRIPTDHRRPVPRITGKGWLVTFGPAPNGTTGTASITVSRGNNDTSGGEYQFQLHRIGGAAQIGAQVRGWVS